MKKYIIFIISFAVLFSVFEFLFQIISGYLMTSFYMPDITSAWNQSENLPSNVVIKGSSYLASLLFALLAAIFAYITSKIFIKNYGK
ncbi:hypothetical protein GCM10007063_30050 [Lentibacillus kapialis]|uniref:Uncharacterized protein n=1 Tax=Lentibacillus kapialis TaxID=340214 RepID=A0A917Q142_9BACI|nr:hypothetical protein [Lentibacillus kapialis]GGK05620.1 hypothetical protein GCM10007063_30050 [Lentibacillus kapialis]